MTSVAANSTGTTIISNINAASSGLMEGSITLTARHITSNGVVIPKYTGTSATLDTTAPKLISIIAGTAGLGNIGMDVNGDSVIFESGEKIVLTDITGTLKNYSNADIGDGAGETSELISALNTDLPFNTNGSGTGQVGSWAVASNTTGANIDISNSRSYWERLILTYSNIGQTGFASNILSETYQYLIPNSAASTVAITDLAGNRISTLDGGTPEAADYDNVTDVDVTEQ